MKSLFVNFKFLSKSLLKQKCCFPKKKEEIELNDKTVDVPENQNNKTIGK